MNNTLPEYLISTDKLKKSYGEVEAVSGLCLKVGRGELFGLLGPNGSGKTTTIKMLTGQIRPSSGSASVMGIDVEENPIGVREATGIIPEQESPPSFLTAEEYLEFVCRIRGLEGAEEKRSEWFKRLDFEDERHVLCKDLSRGTRQKLMFAQAFLHDPDLAFIDEPLINLDPVAQRTVKDFLSEQVKRGKTVFLSTHVLEIAEEICTRFGILHKGELIHEGPVEELKREKLKLEDFFLGKVKEAPASIDKDAVTDKEEE